MAAANGPHSDSKRTIKSKLVLHNTDSNGQVSLREYGGFICSVVDITSEKRAELDERRAAKQAQERKEQQERFIDMISHVCIPL